MVDRELSIKLFYVLDYARNKAYREWVVIRPIGSREEKEAFECYKEMLQTYGEYVDWLNKQDDQLYISLLRGQV